MQMTEYTITTTPKQRDEVATCCPSFLFSLWVQADTVLYISTKRAFHTMTINIFVKKEEDLYVTLTLSCQLLNIFLGIVTVTADGQQRPGAFVW